MLRLQIYKSILFKIKTIWYTKPFSDEEKEVFNIVEEIQMLMICIR